MVHQVTCFTDALSAWENWNLTPFNIKSEHLLSFKLELKSAMPELASVVAYHLQRAAVLLAQPQELIGPTGETNELYTAGRGVTLLIQEDTSLAARQATLAQLCCALVAGNSVIMCSDDNTLTTALGSTSQGASLPFNLLQFVSVDAYQSLMESDIRCVGYIGTPSVECRLNQQLAQRSGAIVSLVAETDFITLPVAHDPHLVLRFITERTRTINITAVGGNATLLELGSDLH